MFKTKTKLKLCWRKTAYIYTPIYHPESTYLISFMGQLPTFLATFSKTCLLKWQQQIEVLAKYSFRIKAFLLCRVFRSILVYINPCVPVHFFSSFSPLGTVSFVYINISTLLKEISCVIDWVKLIGSIFPSNT